MERKAESRKQLAEKALLGSRLEKQTWRDIASAHLN